MEPNKCHFGSDVEVDANDQGNGDGMDEHGKLHRLTEIPGARGKQHVNSTSGVRQGLEKLR